MNTLLKQITATLATILMLPGPIASAQQQPIDEFVRSYAEAHMAESRAPGLVFVHVDSHGSTIQTFGTADIETGRPMTPTTPLRVGSISKPVTAAIALELAAAGELDLDTPVDTYLDVDLSDGHGPASTIRQLLQHRGGYPDAIVGSHHTDPADAMDLGAWISRVPDRPIPHDVVASYSSVGYTVAGAGIAGAAGEPFADVARRVIFDPLGMNGATFDQPAPDDVAVGYSWTGTEFTPYPLDATDLVPGAGLTATGEDLAVFLSALVDEDGPLAATTVESLLGASGPAPGLRAFTTGLAEWRYDTRTVLYHGGNGIGTTNRMTILPEDGVAIFTAVNGEALSGIGDPSTQTQFMRDLHRQIVERFYPTAPPDGDTPTLDGQGVPTRAVAGVYVSTRVDPASPLSLEALVSQSHVAEVESGITFNGREYTDEGPGTYVGGNGGVRFLQGPDGVTYATTGGTGSYRHAAWWETLRFNAALLGGALLAMLAALTIGVRPASTLIRALMIGSVVLTLTFVGLLGYGLSTVEVMDLFTGLPPVIRFAQFAALGLGALSLLVPVTVLTRRADLTRRVLGSSLAISMAGITLTGWALVWGVLPI